MKFKANTRRRALEYEKDLVKWWKDSKTFEKSVEARSIENAYVFYDGPPFITGAPHHGTLLSSLVKDVVPRYQTMRGKRVERVWGWDCHGLPAENFVEKKLGITDRNDIGTKISLADYITTARESMVATGDLWETTIDRIGRWVDFKGGYKTMDKKYMESVWWAFKTLYEKGKIYEGERVLMYDPSLATPLSKAEVTMDAGAYQDVTDPSVYVKFKLVGEDATLLAWTTTPWTLPGNSALAINKDFEYVEVKLDDDTRFVLAKESLDKVLTDEKHNKINYSIVRSMVVKNSKGTVVAGPGTVYQAVVKDWNWDTTSLSDGTYTIDLEARDAANNKGVDSTKTIAVIVDNTAPVVAITSPTTYKFSDSATVAIEGTTDDAAGYNLFINGELTDSGTSFSGYKWNTTGLSSGDYLVRLEATDLVGNVGDGEITIAYTAPAPVVPTPLRATITPTASTSAAASTATTPGVTAADTNGEVLGDNTVTPSSSTSATDETKAEVKGATDTKDDTTWSILGLAWYWWLLIVAAVGLIVWGIASSVARRQD